MNYAAAILDFHDDKGKILKELVPDANDIPEIVKTANLAERSAPANEFALVMVDGDKVYKRFPINDPGSTWLSTLYFGQTGEHLPEEAQKIAAANLILACECYDIEPFEELYKIAGDEPPTGNIIDIAGLDAPLQPRETGEEVFLDSEHHRYPVNTPEEVGEADRYFAFNQRVMDPRTRHDLAVKIASVGKERGVQISSEVLAHANTEFSPDVEGHLMSRYHYLVSQESPKGHLDALQKVAAARKSMSPLAFAEALERTDRATGLDKVWDSFIPDPWFSTFGLSGLSKFAAEAEVPGHNVGTEHVTDDQLLALAERGQVLISDNFGEEFMVKFCADPITVFQSLPLPQKKIIARVASSANFFA